MRHFRKIDPRTWKDERFSKLTAMEKLIALYVMTAQSNFIGLFSFSPAMAAEDLEMPLETFREGFGNVCRRLVWEWDEGSRTVYIPTWWKYNLPANPNILKHFLDDLHEIPDSPLITMFYENQRYIPETFLETFTLTTVKRLPKPSPIRSRHKTKTKTETIRTKEYVEKRKTTTKLSPGIEDVVAHLNHATGARFRTTAKTTLKNLDTRLKEGVTVEQCKLVIDHRGALWKDDPKMRQYLRPDTLFRPSKFSIYLAQAEGEAQEADSELSPAASPEDDGRLLTGQIEAKIEELKGLGTFEELVKDVKKQLLMDGADECGSMYPMLLEVAVRTCIRESLTRDNSHPRTPADGELSPADP